MSSDRPAVFAIFNRIIGTGVFAMPSFVLTLSGSVGLSLFIWVIVAVIAVAGVQVYIVWGSVSRIPPEILGGEKDYLEYLFRKPKFIITSVFSANAVLLDTPPRQLCSHHLLLPLLRHRTQMRAPPPDFLGIFKTLVLVFFIITGFVALSGRAKIEKPNNFTNAFEGTTAGASSFYLNLYNQVSYAIVEVKNPQRVMRIAGPLAIGVVTILYVLANVAYFAGATKEEVTTSGRLVAALLFKNVYIEKAQRALSVFVALSALGNVLSVSFSQGHVNQELGREGILPFNGFWGSNKPFNAPLAGLALHRLICIIVIFALPPGDAYDFELNVPPAIAEPYVSLPYWTQAVAGWAVFGLGLLYYVVWAKVAPWVGGYSLVGVEEVGKDGLRWHVFRTVEKDKSA
ncbi:hypothetical protein CVT25_000316 [Psilocybe cyanescens]|uniref:Amino acid permease/ SLC12A domain-containing protein n=1 Tax=Psilocybe cyanescens TaxID=93625 RepID=A0A409XEV9_PSICY|nr:hypothetical protein CVT25_000316 [Psilocybe cyanescens]